jgi:hypothetical protein
MATMEQAKRRGAAGAWVLGVVLGAGSASAGPGCAATDSAPPTTEAPDAGDAAGADGGQPFGDATTPPMTSCDKANAGKSSVGCDYYVVAPSSYVTATSTQVRGACFAAFVANPSAAPVTIAIERAGQTLNVGQFARVPKGSGASITYAPLSGGQLAPGEVAILFLAQFSDGFACPAGITPAVTDADVAVLGTGVGHAFHITTSEPVVAYDIFPYGGAPTKATSATLLFPTSAWDTNYVAVDGFKKSDLVFEGITGQPFVQMVAAENDTRITIKPTSAIVGGGGVAGTPVGVAQTYNLAKGEVLQITQDEELVGSAVQANKPIGFWGGSTVLDIPVDQNYGDTAHQQIPPVRAMGHEYVAVRHKNRVDGVTEAPPWRIVGAVDGTVLTYDPPTPPSPTAPTTLSAGQLVTFNGDAAFVVKSQDDLHPFYMSGHMTGGVAHGNIGDPEFVNVVPAEQYQPEYVFFADPTYGATSLVIIRAKGTSGFADVTLDCAGTVTGWSPVGSAGIYQFTRVDLVVAPFKPQGACNNGRHQITSSAPFGLTIWGWDELVSYAYPAGVGLKTITPVVVPPK